MLVILKENHYLCIMAKWDDKHIYNWIGWMRSLLAMRESINDWTVSPKKAYKFPVFIANNFIISPLVLIALGLMTIPQTFEWLMMKIIDWVNKEMNLDALDKPKGFFVVVVTIFVLIPYVLTWGLPMILVEIKERRTEKRLETHARHLEQIEEERRRWGDVRESINRSREEFNRIQRECVIYKDFSPNKQIKLHQFNETPKLRIFTRDEQPIRRQVSGRIRRHNRGYYNNHR